MQTWWAEENSLKDKNKISLTLQENNYIISLVTIS